jgi:hypothetical protein
MKETKFTWEKTKRKFVRMLYKNRKMIKNVLIVIIIIAGTFFDWKEVLCVAAAIIAADKYLEIEILPRNRKRLLKKLNSMTKTLQSSVKEVKEVTQP